MVSRILVVFAFVVMIALSLGDIDCASRASLNGLAAETALFKAEPLTAGCCITGVRLGDGSILRPQEPLTKQGYIFYLEVEGTNYEIQATPVTQGATGFQSFFVDRSRIIRHSTRAHASAHDPTLGELPSPAN